MDQIVRQKFKRRDPSLPKGRQISDENVEEIAKLFGDMPRRKDMVIEALHIIQDTRGHITATDIAALAEYLRLAQVEVYEVASFYHHFDIVREGQTPPPPLTIRVCDGLSCEMSGAKPLIEELKAALGEDIRIDPVPCIGRCDSAPAAQVGKRLIEHASVPKLTEAATGPITPVIPDYQTMEEYRAEGGYDVLAQVLAGDITADQATETMSNAGLRGLGGAGFPAGRKWGFVRSYAGPRFMTINGDEGEPGTFKDRWWLEQAPHRMIEGAQISARVVGCERIYIYMRDEYPAVLEILKTEIAVLEASDIEMIPMELRRGAGAYICGEESAMIESIEGKRGLPRHRPPYIAEVGLFGRPTLNHNVETLSWIADILKNGPAWFKDQGWSEDHNGPRAFSVSGRVKNPGVKVAPAGIPLIRLIEDYCGGMADGHELKAFFPGGASGGIFPAHMADRPMDFGTWEPEGGLIGSHAVVILSQHDSVRDATLNTMRFFKHESCGQCTPCRSGTDKMVRMLEAREADRALYDDLLEVMGDSSICGLGQAAGNCVKHLMTHFPEEFENGETTQ
ncbi:NAD(P)H-dependent oxidoreductase subunit E [Pseudohalocynthiibacter aestuariivivens]|jgi:formate dehydrogenase beta subunit|uniref:NAD(P)H-dependent oxidoreductase subunit E n=1 Tax=Pseudohalocynthiibacter aestuariivivens TaxID=1591409 RepID=A0ABV5JEF8_9RHOB|nr:MULTISPECIES: NAD(P)H-dependent oxidoreductase subunit E [Pseudohalocynthiibacter]MBS9718601.1 NAD(P)H-dependent oxidoreductase subunit E [Pseudohalocynthiibacter aestuariivivens]MCK0103612.1 NAD(P)H-dependent oxidoreductase subunit E [Pseudohalocynthiibacter sp. F2068]